MRYIDWDWWLSCFSQKCHNSWQRLRQSPIFGCFCPSNLAQVTYKLQIISLFFWSYIARLANLFFFLKIISPSSRIIYYNWKYDLAGSCFVIGSLEILDAACRNKKILYSPQKSRCDEVFERVNGNDCIGKCSQNPKRPSLMITRLKKAHFGRGQF